MRINTQATSPDTAIGIDRITVMPATVASDRLPDAIEQHDRDGRAQKPDSDGGLAMARNMEAVLRGRGNRHRMLKKPFLRTPIRRKIKSSMDRTNGNRVPAAIIEIQPAATGPNVARNTFCDLPIELQECISQNLDLQPLKTWRLISRVARWVGSRTVKQIVVQDREHLLAAVEIFSPGGLHKIGLHGDTFTDDDLSLLPARLTELDLLRCRGLTDQAIARLSRFSQLEQLSLSGCSGLTDAGLMGLARLPRLLKLDLSNSTQLSNAGLSHVAALAGLQSLDLSGCPQFTDDGLVHLANLSQLHTLDLSHCHRITDAGLSHLSRLNDLGQFNLAGCDELTDASLILVANFRKLHSLEINGCGEITDQGLLPLLNLTKLALLNLESCIGITDHGVAALHQMPALTWLCLDRCDQITDSGITALETSPHLRWLGLDGCTQITDTIIAQFERKEKFYVARRNLT